MTDPIAKAKFNKPLWLTLIVLLVVSAGWLFLVSATQSSPKPVLKETTKAYEPAVYQIKDWTVSKHQPRANTDALKALLGDTATTQEVLDFYGDFARQYRYTAKSEPPLYVIESDALFELAWYYASARDDDATKQISINHAKRAYQVLATLYGDKGTALMQQMLDGKVLDNKQAYSKLILARCQDYLCQFIIKK